MNNCLFTANPAAEGVFRLEQREPLQPPKPVTPAEKELSRSEFAALALSIMAKADKK